MDIKYLQAIADRLSAHFKVRIVKVQLGVGDGSYYHYRKRKRCFISIGKDHRGTDAIPTLIHEFAHHLEFIKNDGKPADKHQVHGPFFVRCLFDTAEVYYGDGHLYPWDQEYYPQVRTIYRKRYCN